MRIDSAIITGSFSVNGDTFNDLGVFPSTGSNTFVGNQTIVGAVSASALTGSIDFTNLTGVPTLVSGSEQIVGILSPLNSYTQSSTLRLNSLEQKTGSLATTGSNTFIGNQTISGTVYIQDNLIVQGSSSLQNITASAVSIGTNIVNLNTANPSIRFAGLSIVDSGSVGGSGSFLYDSLQDEFIFVHRGAATAVTSSVVLMGPQTYDSIGSETYPTNNRIQKGTGNEHLVDSNISDTGALVSVNSLITYLSGSVGIGVSSPKSYSILTINGQSIFLNNIGVDINQSFRLNNYYNSGTGTDRTISNGFAAAIGLDNSTGGLTFNTSTTSITADNNVSVTEKMRLNTSGNLGIGTTSPAEKLSVAGAIMSTGGITGHGANRTTISQEGGNGAFWQSYGANTTTVGAFVLRQASSDFSVTAIPLTIASTGAATFSSSVQSSSLIVAGSGYFPAKIITLGGAEFSRYNANIGTNIINSSQIGLAFGTRSNNVDYNNTLNLLNGRVGVETTNPQATLDVNGNIKNANRVYSANAVTGNIAANLDSAFTRNYILICDLNDIAGFSLSGFMNAASYTCWNISSFFIMKNYSSTTATAGITGQFKAGGCDMNIVDLNYGGGRYIAIGYTSNPEIDVIWTGYRLLHMLNADGSAQVIRQEYVTVNSTLASY